MEKTVLPALVGFLNIWMGIICSPAAPTIYFKSGAFSWNGLICFWLVAVAFSIWIITMSIHVIRGIDIDQRISSVAS